MPTPVSQAYPELMHYTTTAGLRGIVSSGCLWATDASYLNDASEITHFFDVRLKQVIAETVRKRGIELAQSPHIFSKMLMEGGFNTVVDAETTAMVDSLKSVTTSMNRPFVVSLCGASEARVAQSGLLSQWRGYGSDGGFAIVIETAALEDALRCEAERYNYMHVQMGDVYYEGIDAALQPATPDFKELEDVVRKGVARMMVPGGTAADTDGFYEAVTSLSCLCKHWGFWEEREVRIVVIPAIDEVLDPDIANDRVQKAVRCFSRGPVQVPYVELFSTAQPGNRPPKLPIKRIIVGPHRDSGVRIGEVKALLNEHGYGVPVQRSDIPYLGR